MARVKGALNTRKRHKKMLRASEVLKASNSELLTKLLCVQCKMLM